MRHYDEYEIESILNIDGKSSARTRLAKHLEICPSCDARYKKILFDNSFILEVRNSMIRFESIRKEIAADKDTSEYES